VRANTKSPSLRWLATYPEEWAIRYTMAKYEWPEDLQIFQRGP